MAEIDAGLGGEAATLQRLAMVRAAQRAAFDRELPVSPEIRRDRLKRCIAMMVDHGVDFAKAMSEDFGHRSHEQ